MRTILLPLLASCLIALPACTGHADSVSPPASATEADALDSPMFTGSVVLISTLQVNPATLAATLIPDRVASSQIQALSYDLDIAKFLTPDTLRVSGVRLNDFDDVIVRIRQRHPFPKPDFTQEITALNRADLSYTGRIFVLANTATQTIATSYRLDPWLVRDPDGYAPVGDLLRNKAGLTNNLFPYMLIVDEAKNNREGLSNHGTPTGNYDPAIGGWQRANATPGWTGYDYLHAGESAVNDLTLRRANLQAANWTVRLAVVIKYTDPRGIGGTTDRFPPESVDVSQFAYRLPFAALDCSRVTGNWDRILLPGESRTVPIEVKVRDWDTGAQESTDDNLSDEPEVSKVQPGGSGFPSARLIFPDFYPTPVTLNRGAGTGVADDEIAYSFDLENYNEVPAAGDYWGIVAVSDPEFNDTNHGDYHFGVDPDTLVPSSSRALAAITYLPIHVWSHAFNTASWALSWGDQPSLTAGPAAMDQVGNFYVTTIYSTKGNDQEPGDGREQEPYRGGTDFALSKFDHYGKRLWTWAPCGSGNDQLQQILVDDSGTVTEGEITLRFLSNSIGVDYDPGPGTFLAGASTYVQTVVHLDTAGLFKWGATWPQSSPTTPVAKPFIRAMAQNVDGELYLAGGFLHTRDFDPGTAVVNRTSASGSATDAFLMKLDNAGQFQWVDTWGDVSPTDEVWNGVIWLRGYGPAAAGVMASGAANGSQPIDLDPSGNYDPHYAHSLGSPCVVAVNENGTFRWGQSWLTQKQLASDPDAHGAITQLGVYANGSAISDTQIVTMGRFFGDGDFNPGPADKTLTAPLAGGNLFLSSFDATGAWQWAICYADLQATAGTESLWIGPNGNIHHSAAFTGTAEFNPVSGGSPRTASGSSARYITELTSAGTLNAIRIFDPPNASALTGFQSTPGASQLFVSGTGYNGTNLDLNGGAHVLHTTGTRDPFVMLVRENGDW